MYINIRPVQVSLNVQAGLPQREKRMNENVKAEYKCTLVDAYTKW